MEGVVLSYLCRVSAGGAAILFCGVIFGGTDSTKTQEAAAKMANAAYQAGDWSTCGEHFTHASRLASGGVQSGASYNAACCYALAGDADRAFAELTRAIEAGYRDRSHMQQDEDLASLHEDPRWSEAVARAKANADAYVATVNAELL